MQIRKISFPSNLVLVSTVQPVSPYYSQTLDHNPVLTQEHPFDKQVEA